MTEARWALTAMVLVCYIISKSWKVDYCCARMPNAADFNAVWAGELSLNALYWLQSTSALNAAIYMSATPAWCLLLIG
jgi:hypothetical protein